MLRAAPGRSCQCLRLHVCGVCKKVNGFQWFLNSLWEVSERDEPLNPKALNPNQVDLGMEPGTEMLVFTSACFMARSLQ